MSRIPSRHPWNRRAALLAVALAVSACENPQAVEEPAAPEPAFARLGVGAIEDGLARSVRQATSRFNATQQATAAGYAEASECVAVPGLGGMGHHWLNADLVDPGFDPLKPEALVYEPKSNGGLALVAVEYIVVDVGQPAPTFGDQPFDVGGTPLPIPHWSLHAWVHRENPNGLFTPFNPDVTCP
jgi:hypothetical protein